jgi:hypothetical protein
MAIRETNEIFTWVEVMSAYLYLTPFPVSGRKVSATVDVLLVALILYSMKE